MRNSQRRCLNLFDDKLFNKCGRLNRHECVRQQLNRNVSFSAIIEWEMSRCQTTSTKTNTPHTHTRAWCDQESNEVQQTATHNRIYTCMCGCVCVCVTCDQWSWGWGLQQCILGCIPRQHSQVVINGSIGGGHSVHVCVCVSAGMASSPHRGMLTRIVSWFQL